MLQTFLSLLCALLLTLTVFADHLPLRLVLGACLAVAFVFRVRVGRQKQETAWQTRLDGETHFWTNLVQRIEHAAEARMGSRLRTSRTR